jgi:arginyl-tRNA synthetase
MKSHILTEADFISFYPACFSQPTDNPIIMTTLELSGLVTTLEGLGLGPIPQFSESHVLNRPLDIGRSYLADILQNLTECDPNLGYKSIQVPNDIFTADLMVPLPKLSRGEYSQSFSDGLRQRV